MDVAVAVIDVHDPWKSELVKNDTLNGFCLIDVRDSMKPRNVGWTQLPLVGNDPSPIAGLAVARGRVFLAGGIDDLHVVDSGFVDTTPVDGANSLKVPAKPTAGSSHDLPNQVVNGSIRSVIPWQDDLRFVAAESAGLHAVRHANGRAIYDSKPSIDLCSRVSIQISTSRPNDSHSAS